MHSSKLDFVGIFVALLATAVTLLVRRYVLFPIFDLSSPLITFTLAVIAVTWVSGVRYGLFATLLGTFTSTFLRIGEQGFYIPPPAFQARLFLFFGSGILASWVVDSLRSAQRRVEERQQALEVEVFERGRAEAAEREQRNRLAEEMRRREAAELALRE
ncbi:MAG TPA: DUF4118 domain-containing protein, partial [Pirellulales bacterium]|nr:DUF4118 domain-containing protein [Pirellulales bacterium]